MQYFQIKMKESKKGRQTERKKERFHIISLFKKKIRDRDRYTKRERRFSTKICSLN